MKESGGKRGWCWGEGKGGSGHKKINIQGGGLLKKGDLQTVCRFKTGA